MYLVLSTPDPERARRIAAALYSLTRPRSREGERTEYLASVVVHRATGQVAVEIPEGAIPIRAGARDDELPDALEALLPPERAEVAAALRRARGGRHNPQTFLHQRLRASLLTRAEMEAGGWFPEGDDI